MRKCNEKKKKKTNKYIQERSFASSSWSTPSQAATYRGLSTGGEWPRVKSITVRYIFEFSSNFFSGVFFFFFNSLVFCQHYEEVLFLLFLIYLFSFCVSFVFFLTVNCSPTVYTMQCYVFSHTIPLTVMTQTHAPHWR